MTERPGRSRHWWRAARVAALAVAATVVASTCLVALRVPSVGAFHDDGIYVVTARALAEGHGYRIISLPGAPPQTKYPILFPWLLSLVWRIAPPFPANLPWLRLVPLLSTFAWLWLSWRLIQQCGGSRAVATTIVVLTAVAPWTLFLSTTLLSETLFAALLTAALWALTASVASGARGMALCATAGLLGGAAILTRTAGVAVVGAAFAWLVWSRRWKHAAAFVLPALAVALPWSLWVLAFNRSVAEPYYSATPYATWNIVFSYSWPEKLNVLVQNVLYAAMTPAVLWGGTTGPIGISVGLAAIPIVMLGTWRQRQTVVAWAASAVLLMTVLWVWPSTRLIAPVVPLVLWLALEAFGGRARMLVVCVAVSFGVLGVGSTVATAVSASTHGSVWPVGGVPEDWRKMAPLFDWIRQATPPDAVIAGNLDPAYFLFTGRVSVRAFEADSYLLYYAPPGDTRPALGTVEAFRQRLLRAGVDYCIWTPMPGFGEGPHLRRLLDGLTTQFPESLRIAAGDEAAGYVVYAVERSRLVDPGR